MPSKDIKNKNHDLKKLNKKKKKLIFFKLLIHNGGKLS